MKNITSIFLFLALGALVFTFTSCQKQYSLDGLVINTTAQGTLYDTAGNCMASTAAGTFYNGVSPNGNLASSADTAYVLINVNVITTGTYSIVSDLQNGVSFASAGNFTSTGINTVKLLPSGIPAATGSNSYSFTFGNSTCNFTVVTLDSTGRGLGGGGTGGTGGSGGTGGAGSITTGQYTFAAAGKVTTGSAIGAFAGGDFSLTGTSVTGDSLLAISIIFSGASIPSGGQFSTTTTGTAFTFENFSTLNPILNAGLTLGKITFTVTSYNSTTGELICTFSGSALNASGSSVSVTNGAFDVIVL